MPRANPTRRPASRLPLSPFLIAAIFSLFLVLSTLRPTHAKKGVARDLFDDEDWPEEPVAANSMPEIRVVGNSASSKKGIPSCGEIVSTAGDIIEESKNVKKFPNPVLAFVTPWNNHGYDVVKVFRGKFDYVAPVWYQLKPQGDSYYLTGGHDVDQGWVSDVRKPTESGFSAKVVPRFAFEGFSQEDYMKILQPATAEEGQQIALKIANVIWEEAHRQGFDGITLELPMPGYFRQLVPQLIFNGKQIGKEVIIVAPADRGEEAERHPFSLNAFQAFVAQFDNAKVLYMTYDASVPKPGPNAPMPFIETTMSPLYDVPAHERAMVGLAMYGYLYCDGNLVKAILGRDWLMYLGAEQDDKRVGWDEEAKEAFLEFEQGAPGSQISCKATFPTLESIQARLDYAEEHGFGVALWETGQGLDSFYNLF